MIHFKVGFSNTIKNSRLDTSADVQRKPNELVGSFMPPFHTDQPCHATGPALSFAPPSRGLLQCWWLQAVGLETHRKLLGCCCWSHFSGQLGWFFWTFEIFEITKKGLFPLRWAFCRCFFRESNRWQRTTWQASSKLHWWPKYPIILWEAVDSYFEWINL